jgi:ribosomal protein S21
MSPFATPSSLIGERMTNVAVYVKNNDVAYALRRLKRRCEQSGVMSEMRRLEFHTPPCQKRRIEHHRAVKRMEKVKKLFGEA